MKVTTTKPPIYDEANKLFKLEENKMAAIFTYGDTIHNPFGCALTPELIRHEETHMEQQDGHPEVAAIWWKRYLQDPQFRLDQEAEAYGMQYKMLCQSVKDRNARARYLYQIAGHLCGPMYGNLVTHVEAQRLIKQFAEGDFSEKAKPLHQDNEGVPHEKAQA